MSRQFKVQVDFSPSGEDDLIIALRNLATEQNNLSKSNTKMALANEKLKQAQVKTTIAYSKLTAAQDKNKLSIEKLKKQNQILKTRVEKSTLALEKYKASLGATTRTGVSATRSNRLLSNSFATMRSTILLASFGIGLISGSFIKLAKLAGEQKRVEDSLTVALGRRSQALIDQASELQQLTGFGDEAIIGAQAQLAAFTNSEEQIKTLTTATLDFATAQGMSLTEAAKLLGKTIGSSTNALSRYGVEVTGAVGSTERLNTAVEGITNLFGGQAEAKLSSFGGQLELAGGNIFDVGEDLGAELVPALTTALQSFNKFAKKLQNSQPAFEKLKLVLKGLTIVAGIFFIRLRFVRNIFIGLGKVIKAILSPSGKLKKVFTSLGSSIQTLGKAFKRNKLFTIGKRGLSGNIKRNSQALRIFDRATLKTGLQSMLLGSAIGTLGARWTGLGKSIKGAFGNIEEGKKGIEDTTLVIAPLTKEQKRLAMIQGLAARASDKLAQKQFLLAASTAGEELQTKSFVKTLQDFNKQTKANIEIKDVQSMQDLEIHIQKMAITDEEKEKLIETAENTNRLNMITLAGSITNAEATRRRIDGLSQLGQTLTQLNPKSKSLALVALRLDQIKAVANAYGAAGQYMDQDPPRPGLAAMALTQGLANAAMIEKQFSKARAAATGADFVTQGRQMLMVGDNESGRERVQVTPLGNDSRGSVGESSTVTINLNGNVLGTSDFVRDTLIPEIENTINRNLA